MILKNTRVSLRSPPLFLSWKIKRMNKKRGMRNEDKTKKAVELENIKRGASVEDARRMIMGHMGGKVKEVMEREIK